MFRIRKISTQKFFFSEEYREGVNDAFNEVLLFKQKLIESYEQGKGAKLCDRMIDLANCLAEENNIELEWNNSLIIICEIIYHVFTRTTSEFDQLKKINSDLNKKLIERNSRDGVSLKLRYEIFKRDCFKCCYCGCSPANDPKVTLMIDHIRPVTKGGKNILDNYQTLCNYCNAGKGNNF